ncbi:uncharacterized protein LOC141627517 [Silene latifolia]|uniref:uncharacterized protein LOC141627517 n=1 Tax=Silene latifolia TaxID=37657 RepID=UPI003D78403B
MARSRRISSPSSTSKIPKSNITSSTINPQNSTITVNNNKLSESVSQVNEAESSSMAEIRDFNLDKELTKEEKQCALHFGPMFFDNKPFIVKEWVPGMKLLKDKPYAIPIWIRLYDLDIKYWGLALPKIDGLVGKPICSDQATKNKECLRFPRYLVEVKLGEQLPDSIEFIDENDVFQKQLEFYEWKPVVYTVCNGIGHETGLCKKKMEAPKPKKVQQVWKPKVTAPSKPLGNLSGSQPGGQSKNDVVLPVLQLNMVVTPMPYQGSVLNSLTPARILNRFSKKGQGHSGLNKKNKQGDVRRLLHQNKVGLFGLMETKVKTIKINTVQAGLGNKWMFLNNNDLKEGGRIWLLWDPGQFTIRLMMKDEQVIHVSVEHLLTGFSWVCSLVYGYNKDSKRAGLWQSLLQCKASVFEPWLIIEEYNNVLHSGERIGSDVTLAEIKEF